MWKRVVLLGVPAFVSLLSLPLQAQGVVIDHSSVGCVIAGQHPKMNACFDPASSLARARVYFRAEGGPSWYFVEMKPDTPCFLAVLPKPTTKIARMNYYVEAVDKGFAESRTSEYDPAVVPDAGSCRKDVPAAPFVSKASIVVGAAPGAPAVPAGFGAAGIVGAAGVSAGVVVAGVAAAGAATTVVVTKGSDATPTTPASTVGSGPQPTLPPTTTAPAPTPTPPPTPAPATNSPPKAVFKVNPDPPEGASPLKVSYNMCSSTDPDGDDLKYTYDFGDGATDQGFCRSEHTYSEATLARAKAAAGALRARVCVTDRVPDHQQCADYRVVVVAPVPRNSPPRGVFSVSPSPPSGPPPLVVTFDMCASSDPDGDALSFRFDFGDGGTASGACRVSHTYPSPAGSPFTAQICVTDGLPGHDQCQGYTVSVSCATPSVTITSPANGSSTDICPIPVRANASDPAGIAFVEFFQDDGVSGPVSIGIDNTPPYEALAPGGVGVFTLKAQAHNTCGQTAEDSVTVNGFCFPALRSPSKAVRLTWTSQLDVAGARGQVVLNGTAVFSTGPGRSVGQGEPRKGENRIEAQLVEATGALGTWRFDLASTSALEPGSLRVVAGEVAAITADAVVFRLQGKAGERIAFRFRLKE